MHAVFGKFHGFPINAKYEGSTAQVGILAVIRNKLNHCYNLSTMVYTLADSRLYR